MQEKKQQLKKVSQMKGYIEVQATRSSTTTQETSNQNEST